MATARTEPAARTARQAVARNLGWLLASRAVLAILSLIYLAIATRTLGLTDFGRFALITGGSQALTVFVGFQTWQIIVQYGTEHLRRGDQARLAQLLRACALLDLGGALTGMAIALLIVLRWGPSLGIGPGLIGGTLLFTAAQLLSVRSTPVGMLRMRDAFSVSALADSTTPMVRVIGAAAAALFMPTVSGFLIAWSVAEVLTAAAYWVLMARSGDLVLFRKPQGAAVGGLLRNHPGFVRFAIGTNANSTLGLSSKQVPLLLVGGTGGPAVAGSFRVALQLAQSLTKLSQLLARAAFPEIVRAIGTAGIQNVGRMILRSCLLAGMIAAVVFLLIVAGGKPMLHLIGGPAFVTGYGVLLWLAAAGSIDLVTAGFDPLIMAANRTGWTFFARLAGLGALFAATFWLAVQPAQTRVAIGVLLSSLIVALLLAAATVALVRAGAAGAKVRAEAEALTPSDEVLEQ